MDDDIKLTPIPSIIGAPWMNLWIDDLRRAAVLADRERRAKQAQPAKPKAHEAMLSLGENGSWSCYPPSIHGECATATIRWTDDGRAWIDSERNRGLARVLRYWTIDDKFAALDNAADALDGGVR